MCEVTKHINSDIIKQIINDFIIPFDDINIYVFNKFESIKIFINGEWLGYLKDPITFINYYKYNRNNKKILSSLFYILGY